MVLVAKAGQPLVLSGRATRIVAALAHLHELRAQFHLRGHRLEQAPVWMSPNKKDTAMPMMPGPLAVATYVTIKVAGYAGFGHVLNQMLGRSVGVWKFGAAKTGIGMVAGLAYFLLMMSLVGDGKISDTQAYAGIFPFRVAAWGVALALFYGYRDRKALVILALIAGVLWSYFLDGAMALLYHVPGMAMAIC